MAANGLIDALICRNLGEHGIRKGRERGNALGSFLATFQSLLKLGAGIPTLPGASQRKD
jgi:predicted RNase H-like nuclease